MKRKILSLFLLGMLGLTLGSCKKEESFPGKDIVAGLANLDIADAKTLYTTSGSPRSKAYSESEADEFPSIYKITGSGEHTRVVLCDKNGTELQPDGSRYVALHPICWDSS